MCDYQMENARALALTFPESLRSVISLSLLVLFFHSKNWPNLSAFILQVVSPKVSFTLPFQSNWMTWVSWSKVTCLQTLPPDLAPGVGPCNPDLVWVQLV